MAVDQADRSIPSRGQGMRPFAQAEGLAHPRRGGCLVILPKSALCFGESGNLEKIPRRANNLIWRFPSRDVVLLPSPWTRLIQ